jgi:hypothetical protein
LVKHTIFRSGEFRAWCSGRRVLDFCGLLEDGTSI